MFLLAQISDLLYLFFLMFLSETIFRASKEILYGVISIFFILKIILLYFYINNRKYSILYFILLRFILFVFPAFYFIGLFLNIEFIIQSGIIYYILFLFTLIIDFICIYKSSPFKIWKIVLILLYLCITYCLIMIIFLLIGEVSL
ncbi:hypothetical protein CTM98_12105 [Fusobacterium pseudoperiodonticum]|uniref:DUF3397 domain-containing protein n=1 Tax=Fusobacterium pseudoperiodonticum TaxID=2663009 RepID=A0A2D3PUM2_9FUSO|nr:hypothetical protein CTM98_12105 [Fusobacterium pseudoperiodonticum]